ncbi:hypothetical protein QP922_06840 [Corynebacterium sp. MSK218]|uniref:hypothetical protein n=1 Tax=Corynebacterium sp. MSK218 TaxID=3050218 RepID=UPI00254C8B8C|nr:hypothetical protein [Corynebacterium sp. MSK218]MDK8763538.1 hypothetical protein [Corynebacterium sp. MSK218]
MKHINRTLTAAVLAGSLALGGTAVASAQIPAPAVFELEGTTYQRQADGSYKSTNELGSTSLTAEQAQAAWERLQEKEAPADNQEEGPTTTIQLGDEEEAPAPAPENPDPAPAGPSKVDTPIDNGTGGSEQGSAKPEAPGSKKPETPGSEKPEAGKEEPTKPSGTETAPTGGSQAPSTPADDADFDTEKLAWLALPAALIIGGVTWYLAKDGKTYVKTEEAAQKDAPSAEEKAASEQMLKENKDEVIAQGGKVAESTAEKSQAQSRGISAETGSNTVARGLAALAIAAMIAAGAFVARRKLFI